jgi:hypothetical protein
LPNLSYNIEVKYSLAKILTAFIFVFLCIFFVSKYSSAAIEIPIQDSDISVETTPENPEPYQNVTIKISSYATDLNKAKIVWTNNSKVVLSGIGETSYSFQALGPNSALIFNIAITPESSINKINKQVVIKASEIELLWEAIDGYTPLFYKGKSFASAEGMIKVVGIPNTNTIKSGKGSMVYSWKSKDSNVVSASGYNKDSYVFKNSELNSSEDITVIASSVDGQYDATKQINIPIVSPKVIFYKKSPTDGILYNQALVDDTLMSENEFTIVAEPFFLAYKNKESAFTYDWKINGESIATPSRKTELTIRPTSRGGYANISITMEDLKSFFQKVTGQLKLTL